MHFNDLPEYRPGNRVLLGSTRCGKSTAEIIDIVTAAVSGTMAVVVIDPHVYSLAWGAFVQLVARGQKRRILFDRLSLLSRFLGYRFLRRSTANSPYQRDAENEQTVRESMDVFMRRRDIQSLASNPLTEEFLFDAFMLVLYQTSDAPVSDVQYAFQTHHKRFKELVRGCTHQEIRDKFQRIAKGEIKPGQFASAYRLIRGVCASPAFTMRCRATLDLANFLDRKGILLVEGPITGVSADTANTIMGSIILQVIQYVRSRRKSTPRVLLAIDEATNANLVGAAGHEVRALAELQKKGLDIHILCQSPSFPSSFIEDAVFTNCIEHHWFFAANDAVAQKAARDLGDPEYRNRVRSLRRGERYIKRLNHVTFDKVTPLTDSWVFPGLADAKARKALATILARPEYWSPTCSPETSQPSPNETTETQESSTSPADTSASPDTSSESSPAKRLRTEQSPDSENSDDSEPSGTS